MNRKEIIIKYDMQSSLKFKEGEFYDITLQRDKISYITDYKTIGVETPNIEKFLAENNKLLVRAKFAGKTRTDGKFLFIIDIISINRNNIIETILK